MLTIKENLLETLKKDGHPDRFVKGFEFLKWLHDEVHGFKPCF